MAKIALKSFEETRENPPDFMDPPPVVSGLNSMQALVELHHASRVQERMLPPTLPKIPGLSLAGMCLSAGHLGGDFYDVIELPDKRVLVTVADVMGKGAPASLMAATLRGQIRGMANLVRGPAEILEKVNNDMFAELNRMDAFITTQIAIIEPWGRYMKVANAGHCSPMILTGSGKVTLLSPDGFPIGIMPNVEFVEEEISLEFERALLYTDGITESRNQRGELLGEEGLAAWLAKTRNSEATPQELVKDLQLTLQTFQLSLNPQDDQTALLISRE